MPDSLPRILNMFCTAGLFCLLTTGCQTAMPHSPASPDHLPPPPETYSVPLRFMEHNFDAYCYNAVDCQLVYNNHGFFYSDEPHTAGTGWFPPPSSADYKKLWGLATYIGVRNFPAPADVSWKSLDGREHHVFVDIGRIFAEQLIWHQVPADEMVYQSVDEAGNRLNTGDSPSIFIEINDRTINVYMRGTARTRSKQIPGNNYSFYRRDLFLAWTHTY